PEGGARRSGADCEPVASDGSAGDHARLPGRLSRVQRLERCGEKVGDELVGALQREVAWVVERPALPVEQPRLIDEADVRRRGGERANHLVVGGDGGPYLGRLPPQLERSAVRPVTELACLDGGWRLAIRNPQREGHQQHGLAAAGRTGEDR